MSKFRRLIYKSMAYKFLLLTRRSQRLRNNQLFFKKLQGFLEKKLKERIGLWRHAYDNAQRQAS